MWLVALAGLAAAIQVPGSLFVNLGPGDEPFARGFRGGWERDGALQDGATTFRWALDGSRFELPVEVLSGRLEARIRLARFTDAPAEILVRVGERLVARWVQHPRGWTERVLDLGEPRGPLELRFRTEGTDAEGLAVALDWVEIRGVNRLRPAWRLLGGMLALLIGVPVLVGLMAGGLGTASAAGTALALAGAVGVCLDRLGGLVALGSAGWPGLLAAAALLLLHRGLRRIRPQLFPERAVWVPLAATTLALLALSQPFFYYPDVDTHAEFLAALRADPMLAWDPFPFQMKVGAWTREIGGQRIGFPYSPVFHLAAWLPALGLGEVAAVKLVACVAVGASLLLVHGLAGALALGSGAALLAQGLFAMLPVVSSRLSLALFPALLGQAFDLVLVLVLVFSLPGLRTAQDGAVVAALAAAQAAYTGSLFNVCLLVGALAVWERVSGERQVSRRLLAAWAGTCAVVIALQYARFVPTLIARVLPAMLSASGGVPGPAPEEAVTAALQRAGLFYGPLYPLLTVLGLLSVRTASIHARRVLTAVLVAGLCLLLLRYLVPALFRDAKEVELIAAPVAVLSSAALARVARSGSAGRAAAVALGLGLLLWGAARAASAYLDRFVAVGR
jgi:hypothetical protein